MNGRKASHGFTLVEIIMTILILGLVAMMGVQFFNPSVSRTRLIVDQLQVDANLQLVLENMIQDASSSYSKDMSGLNANIEATGSTGTTYGKTGNGVVSYYIENKQFVCPNSSTSTFDVAASSNQFLLVTIKPSATSGVSLTYVFSNTSNSKTNANACGS